jgi:hypothetical protein
VAAYFHIGGQSRVGRDERSFSDFDVRPYDRRTVDYGNETPSARFNRLDAFFPHADGPYRRYENVIILNLVTGYAAQYGRIGIEPVERRGIVVEKTRDRKIGPESDGLSGGREHFATESARADYDEILHLRTLSISVRTSPKESSSFRETSHP